MGEIRVRVKLSNFGDPSRRATAEMLVDTGATRISLPSGLVRRLGLRKVAEAQVEYADGRKARVPVVAPLRIAIDGRAAVTEALRAPARTEPLLGWSRSRYSTSSLIRRPGGSSRSTRASCRA